MNSPATAPRPGAKLHHGLLVAGLVIGILAAASGLREVPGELPENAVAQVNQRLILREAWLRAVAAVAADRRTPLSIADKQVILQRLVDEELLVQHGLALGLVEQDRRLRGQLISDVVAMTTARSATEAISDTDVERFYREHQDFFAIPARLRVTAWRVPEKKGGDPDSDAGSPFLPPVPDALLPPAKLKTYLGPSLTQRALALRAGEVSEPIRNGDHYVVLQLHEVEPGVAPPLAGIVAQVRAEMQRRRDEAGLRRLLDDLRDSSTLRIRQGLE